MSLCMSFLKSFYEHVSAMDYQSEYIIHKDIMFNGIDVNIKIRICNHTNSLDINYMEFLKLLYIII